MLTFFPFVYKDELLYSAIARYHYYVGNVDSRDTLEELFGTRNTIPHLGIGSNLNYTASQIYEGCSAKKLIQEHTIYPYYSNFLEKSIQISTTNAILSGAGSDWFTKIGIAAGGICRKKSILYCPICAENDIKKYGEPYIHREHQLEGITWCAHHPIALREYPLSLNQKTRRLDFIRFDPERMDFRQLSLCTNPRQTEINIKLAKMTYEMLYQPFDLLDLNNVKNRYRDLLNEKELLTLSGQVRQNDLYEQFIKSYSNNILQTFESDIDPDMEFNWLRVLTRKGRRSTHPIRHLLFLDFLGQSINSFFDLNVDYEPFGKGDWRCLNRASNHYGKRVIKLIQVTRDYRSGKPVGTFKCPLCGFVYSRKGPDKNIQDEYTIGRIKIFGPIWARTARTMYLQNKSFTETAKQLEVDRQTVKKHLFDDENMINTKESIKKELKSEKSIVPKVKKVVVAKNYKRVDWEKRDEEYKNKILDVVTKILEFDKPKRVTRSLIGTIIGIKSSLDNNLENLPKTKLLLDQMIESKKEFQIRRAVRVIDEAYSEDKRIRMWEIQRKAGIRTEHFLGIKLELENYLKMKEREIDEKSETTYSSK
ncbi:TnsD family Tn7-like transposition protein [Acetobacterium carbinolicum]|uniref:TnsD family Tn7-like transposition protein n=1 Tax=Acetobacterium carbinolicum TaxID=52690 RepID=UPI0039BF4C1F